MDYNKLFNYLKGVLNLTTDQQLADWIGMPNTSLSEIRNGKKELTFKYFRNITSKVNGETLDYIIKELIKWN